MFDIGWSELLVIGVVAIIVVGPKELPRLMRTFGHYAGKLRRAASEFQRQFEEAVRESEIDEVRKAMQDFREQAPRADFRARLDEPLMVSKPQPPPSVVTGDEASPPAPATPLKQQRKARSKPAKSVSARSKAKPKTRKPRRPRELKS
jgi:sec-independent protein translocase protein TatB